MVPDVRHELSPPYVHTPFTLNFVGQLHGHLPMSASTTSQSSVRLRSPSSFSWRLLCLLYITWGCSHFRRWAFLRFFKVWLMGRRSFPWFAYFTIKNVSRLSTARDLFSSLMGPNLDSLWRMSPSLRIFGLVLFGLRLWELHACLDIYPTCFCLGCQLSWW